MLLKIVYHNVEILVVYVIWAETAKVGIHFLTTQRAKVNR